VAPRNGFPLNLWPFSETLNGLDAAATTNELEGPSCGSKVRARCGCPCSSQVVVRGEAASSQHTPHRSRHQATLSNDRQGGLGRTHSDPPMMVSKRTTTQLLQRRRMRCKRMGRRSAWGTCFWSWIPWKGMSRSSFSGSQRSLLTHHFISVTVHQMAPNTQCMQQHWAPFDALWQCNAVCR